MGTYTTNYQLYMPTVGETGWGTLVNTNFSTIDTTMKGLSNRITAVENEVNGALSCTSVTTSGKITGNGGIAGTTGTFSGNVTAKYVGVQSMGYKYIFTSDRNVIFPAVMYSSGKELEIMRRELYFERNGSTTSTVYLNNCYVNGAYSRYGRITDAEVQSGSWTYSIGIYGTGNYATSGLSVTGKIVCNGSTININNSAATTINLTNLQNLLKYPSTVTLTTNGYANNAYMSIFAKISSAGYVWVV